MSMYIKSASGISHQAMFKNPGFAASLLPLEFGSKLISPNFKEYMDAALLRRMAEILRMSIACSVEGIKSAGVETVDAIIVGTGLGCLLDTEKFLKNAITIEGGMLPPTSFIQSTHNTVAGQISLILQNHAYNMTHTQNTLSFEHALLDASLNLEEGMKNVLVGSADEVIEPLFAIANQIGFNELNLSAGAHFFVVSSEKSEEAKVKISDLACLGLCDSIEEQIHLFLASNNLSFDALDLILYANPINSNFDIKSLPFDSKKAVNYTELSGVYATNSAFALHVADDLIRQGANEFRGVPAKGENGFKRILICNYLNSINLGLILLEPSEA